MLEQLKEVIIEMELLMRDCCHPIMTNDESKECNTTSRPNVSEEKDIDNEKRHKPEVEEKLRIRVDPCFRKVFSPSIFPNMCKVDGDSAKRNHKKRVSLYKLKSINPPDQYRTIFQCDSDSDIGNVVLKPEFPVKIEPQIELHTNGFPGPECSALDKNVALLDESDGEEAFRSKSTCIANPTKVKNSKANAICLVEA